MLKIQSMCRDIERWEVNEVQIPDKKIEPQRPPLDTLVLADEVGLGKTIEAGFVISQKWAERKRRILIITPANLRKQWHQEMQEKFFLPCAILETRSYNEATKRGNFRPCEAKDAIVFCSYQFARAKAAEVNATQWDLVVIDEAHRLRNVYKPSNVIANTLKLALKNAPKLLLTATPLQNSLLELFGLVSFIDEHAFGDLRSFREQFAVLTNKKVFESLKARLKPVCHRTLRRQVTAYFRADRSGGSGHVSGECSQYPARSDAKSGPSHPASHPASGGYSEGCQRPSFTRGITSCGGDQGPRAFPQSLSVAAS